MQPLIAGQRRRAPSIRGDFVLREPYTEHGYAPGWWIVDYVEPHPSGYTGRSYSWGTLSPETLATSVLVGDDGE